MLFGGLIHQKVIWCRRTESMVPENSKNCTMILNKDKNELIISGFGFDAPLVHGMRNNGLHEYHISKWSLIFCEIKDNQKNMRCGAKLDTCYCCKSQKNKEIARKYHDGFKWALVGNINDSVTQSFPKTCGLHYDKLFGIGKKIDVNFSIDDFFKGILSYKERVLLFNFMVNNGRPTVYSGIPNYNVMETINEVQIYKYGSETNSNYHSNIFDIESVKLPKRGCCS